MVIVYGGSFNPPTIAHIHIAKYLIQKYQPKPFIFVPVGDRYHKKDLAPFNHRKAMLEIATQGLNDVAISDFENTSVFKGTIELLETIQEIYPDDVYFVLGADNLMDIETWIRFEELVKKFKFIVFPRDGIDVNQKIQSHPVLRKHSSHFFIEKDFIPHPISASLYRKEGKDEVVLKEVNDYIYRHQLYERGV